MTGLSRLDLLEACLLDLVVELGSVGPPLILGGGYGLYLKQRHLLASGQRTLLSALPVARSTNDLDVVLRTEVLADPDRASQWTDVLARLGYRVLDAARYYQFVRRWVEPSGRTADVKLDLLMGPPYPPGRASELRLDAVRIRPRGRRVGLHARRTPEAIGVEEHPTSIPVRGNRTNGEAGEGTVFLPQPFSYALMKLFAMRDRMFDPGTDFGRHHALDLYAVVAMTTEEEFRVALELSQRYRRELLVREAAALVEHFFGSLQAPGALRLREHPLCREDLELEPFLSVLAELFPMDQE